MAVSQLLHVARMKQFKILHQTTYNYASFVQLLPHTLRLRPREGHELRIASSKLNIFPRATLKWHRDVEGNSVAIASFQDRANTLNIESEIIIEKYDLFPFDFLVSGYAIEYPFSYLDDDNISLSPYMKSEPTETNDPINDWVKSLWARDENIQTISLLLRINQDIFQNLTYLKREEEGVQSPELTLASGSGSCRDFAYLFMEAAQRLKLAARFVSGYVYSDYIPARSGSTHAWAEVFIPGAGWKGFDPTFGALVGAEHISVAVARRPELVPPIAGDFYGAPGSSMTVCVSVTEVT
nr:transglutaminase family protein [Hahella ganghwensis]